MPLSARYASSPEGQPAAAKREAIPCDNHPDKVGTPAMGRQLGKSQKAQACPKAGQNRRLHRYVDLRQRGGPLHRSAPHTFLFRPCTAHFSFGKTERGPRRAPRGGERRSKGAEGGMPTHGRPDGSGLCDDEGDVAQYLGMDAFFNLQ